jgi:hypothetical protein
MDKVLSRPLFKKKYLEFQAKQVPVKSFQTGGIASLSPKEKAIYAASFAAPLLQSTQRPGESRLAGLGRALGEGLEKLPSTILAVEKQKGTGTGMRTLGPNELKQYNLPQGTVAQIDSKGKITVVSKPTSEQLKERRGYQRTRGLLGEIAKDYVNLGKPVGPLDLKRTAAFFGKYGKSDFAKQYYGFKTKIDQATIFLTQAISGAQVSDQERERIKELIPQVGDTERVFEAKIEALENYLGAAQNISENTGGDITTAIEILEKSGGVQQFVDFTIPAGYERTKSGAIKILTE